MNASSLVHHNTAGLRCLPTVTSLVVLGHGRGSTQYVSLGNEGLEEDLEGIQVDRFAIGVFLPRDLAGSQVAEEGKLRLLVDVLLELKQLKAVIKTQLSDTWHVGAE